MKEEFGHNEDVLGEGVVVVEMERNGEGEVEDHNDQLPTFHEEAVVPAVVVTRHLKKEAKTEMTEVDIALGEETHVTFSPASGEAKEDRKHS